MRNLKEAVVPSLAQGQMKAITHPTEYVAKLRQLMLNDREAFVNVLFRLFKADSRESTMMRGRGVRRARRGAKAAARKAIGELTRETLVDVYRARSSASTLSRSCACTARRQAPTVAVIVRKSFWQGARGARGAGRRRGGRRDVHDVRRREALEEPHRIPKRLPGDDGVLLRRPAGVARVPGPAAQVVVGLDARRDGLLDEEGVPTLGSIDIVPGDAADASRLRRAPAQPPRASAARPRAGRRARRLLVTLSLLRL